ncbi:MAG: MFS transporter [Flavobacterium sp.]|nr:MFS transporter [Flavobacterium sp.]
MKVKGLRWWIIGLIMVITIINYLDRGTLNYMWVANIEYQLVNDIQADFGENQAQFLNNDHAYLLVSKRGDTILQKATMVNFKDNGKIVVNRQGIAYELGIVDKRQNIERFSSM